MKDNQTVGALMRLASEIGELRSEIRETRRHNSRNWRDIEMKLTDLLAKAQAEKTVDDSIVALLGSINQQLKDALANGDLDTIQAISDQLDANTKEISDAVIANTPAAP